MGSRLSYALSSAALMAMSGHAVAADLLIDTPLDARAWLNPIPIANTQIGLRLVGHRVDYHETTPTAPRFSSESGWLPGLQLEVSSMATAASVRNVYFMAALTWIHGNTQYGAGGGAATSDRSGADVVTIDVRFGKGFDIAADWMATPYLGMGYRSWDRDLSNRSGPFGYDEFYEHAYVGGGLLLQWAATERLVLSASGLIGTTLAPTITTSYNGGFPITPWTYNLGRSALYMAGVSADYTVTDRWHINAGIDFLSFRYGASAVAPDLTYEPDSWTSNWTVKAGFGYSFDRSSRLAAGER